MDHHGQHGRNTNPVPHGLYLGDELRVAEDGPVVENRVIEDVGHQPGEGVEAVLSLLPAELEAEAGVVQATHSQRELQQVVLIFCLVPPSLQSHKKKMALECQGGMPSGPLGKRPLPQKEQLYHKGGSQPLSSREISLVTDTRS